MPKKPLPSDLPILVVEDDGLVRMVAVDMLEEAGFEVLEAGSADAAWAILERTPAVGALFTDIDMPGSIDGLVLAGRVAERWPHIRLVVTSGGQGLCDKECRITGASCSSRTCRGSSCRPSQRPHSQRLPTDRDMRFLLAGNQGAPPARCLRPSPASAQGRPADDVRHASMMERILFAKPSTAKGLVIICMPGSRWPDPKAAFSA